MANSKHHFKVYGERKKHKDNATQKSKRKVTSKRPYAEHIDKRGRPDHELARKFQVSIHAVERYAERIFGLNKRDLSGEQAYSIAKAIRESLPDKLINEAKYNVVDNYYALVNNGIIVTIVSKGSKK